MLTTGTQNLAEPLAQAQAAYYDRNARLARRVERFASSVQFVLDDPDAARHLPALTKDLRPGRPSGDGPADPVGRALVTALLDPARAREPDLPVPFDLWVMRRMTMGLVRWAGLAGGAPSPPDGGSLTMMHVWFMPVSADPRVLAGCIGYLEDEARPVLESQHGSLGITLLQGHGVVISESFWATHAALRLSQETNAKLRGELARGVQRPVTANDYQVAVFEREAPPGQAVRVTRVKVKPAAVPDVVHVYGDTAAPRLADTPGFCEALLFVDPEGGQLISQTGWRDPAARAASPSVAEMIRSDVLADDDCQIRAVEDYRLVFDSARKPGPASG